VCNFKQLLFYVEDYVQTGSKRP